ncbi:sugar diacid recognition domain-containing protein [Sporosarcina gallistercoris]|uniref:Helix-turn-helix domain-containing protein n=1 Tax=Sporosarcina gallistercoris TaxID=2762245 RepID=A0ABR8PJV5_9BACL|nr:sugar diacid recognition domain-containing protein [Sporosarcina gallistercoris]MBD7908453.1 helix-turn-helix domain-containing protein [Sporosarcina gallistercoris]
MQNIGHYAQSIVEQFSSILNIPISITDNEGKVIGSTDNNRLGSHHIATSEVTRSGKMMFFTKEQTADLVNVLPGIAAPLRFQQETVGVLGLIGDPLKVERYVQFVQSHIEMMLMENHRSRTVASQMETMRDFFKRLSIFKEKADYSNLHRYCELHGFTLGIPRRSILLDIQSSDDARPSNEQTHTFNHEEQELYICLKNLFIQNELDRVVPLTTGEWLILIADHAEEKTLMRKRLELASDKLRNFLDARDIDNDFVFSFSDPSSSIERLIDDYEHCRRAVMIARRHHVQQSIVSVDDWNLLSHRVDEITLPAQRTLDNHIEKLMNHVNGTVLIESFLVYCDEQLNMSQAARKLYIHRNTLLYRLQQLQDVLSIDLNSFKQCTLLYLALKKHQYFNEAT